MNAIDIRPLSNTDDARGQLGSLLIETVAAGGSVSFMHPLAPADAETFWQKSLAAAVRGERTIFGAWEGGTLVGTVTLLTDFPPNQPHRAEVAKLMTRSSHRGRGIARMLMRALEAKAVGLGKTLLVLDTATVEGAGGFYEKLGFTLTGEIPDFALTPDGRLSGTLIYWKRIG